MRIADRLVIDLMPGWGFMSKPWREIGWPVLWGPDIWFSEDVRDWTLAAGIAWGIVSGPPCQHASIARWGSTPPGKEPPDLIPEFERVVAEVEPEWFLMENVRQARPPWIQGYTKQSCLIDSRDYGCAQSRVRRFTFGSRSAVTLAIPLMRMPPTMDPDPCLTAPRGGGRRTAFERRRGRSIKIPDLLRGVGLPEDTPTPWALKQNDGWGQMLANAVPLPIGRAFRDAIIAAYGIER